MALKERLKKLKDNTPQKKEIESNTILSLIRQLKKENEKQLNEAIVELKSEIKEEIRKTKDDVTMDGFFSDLEPEKNIAKKTVKEEIRSFKEEVTEKIKSVLRQLKENNDSLVVSTKKSVDIGTAALNKATGESLKSLRKEAANVEKQSREVISTFSNLSKEIEKKRGPKGDKGDKGDVGIALDGSDGRDGSPDLPIDIKNKLEKLKGEKRLDKSAIKGLEELFNDFKRAINNLTTKKGGGGGGMGQPQHETFAISAGTISVTTSFNIAAGGNAIFKAAYEGAELHKDTHFTVSGKVITFDSDVQAQFLNDTNFDVTYIRT